MPIPIPVDELYAVSDLHLGGVGSTQIFNQGNKLATFIELVRCRPSDKKVVLVLNGDIVDFLADEEDATSYLKPHSAVAILDRVIADPSFSPVWKALARYVQTADRFLVMCLGNHDVELALPRSRQRLMRELCGDDHAASKRIEWSMDGKGFACEVGSAKVFCTHGNEVDSWNIVDYAQLAQVKAAQEAGQSPLPWDPNAGTQLVIDVMNVVKKSYPFVDLLKPETKIIPPMILSLNPSYLGLLNKFGSILYRRMRGTVRTLFLGSADAGDSQSHELAEEEFVRGVLLGPQWQQKAPPSLPADQVLKQMEADFQAGRRPQEVLAMDGQEGMLGLAQFMWDNLLGRPKMTALREALGDWLKNDKTFEFTTADDTFDDLDKRVDAKYDFVLAGHTHLARALPRKNGQGVYFNSGTWIRLIHLTQEMLKSDESFTPIYNALTDGSMEAIDRQSSLILDRHTVVRIQWDGQKVMGELTHVQLDGPDSATLVPEPQTRFDKR